MSEYMATRTSQLVTAAARVVAGNAGRFRPSQDFYHDTLMQWTLAADDEDLFDMLDHAKGIWVPSDLFSKAVTMGANCISRKLALSGSYVASDSLLDKALCLDDPAMVRLLVSEMPTPLDTRAALSPVIIQKHFLQKNLAAIEALLNAGPNGINATLPCDLKDYPRSVLDRNRLGWGGTVSRILRRLIDTNSISVDSAQSFLYAAYSVGAEAAVAQLVRFPGIEFSLADGIALACQNGHGAVVERLLSEARNRGKSLQDDEGHIFSESERKLFLQAAECDDRDVIAAFIQGFGSNDLSNLLQKAIAITKFFGHTRTHNILLSKYIQLKFESIIDSTDCVIKLADSILADHCEKVAELVDQLNTSSDIGNDIVSAAALAGSRGTLAWAADRWSITNLKNDLDAALTSENLDIAKWLVLHGADPGQLTWSTFLFLVLDFKLDALEVLIATPSTLPKLGERFDIGKFIGGNCNEISRFLESGPTSVRRRSRIALALLRAGVATIPQPYDSHHADILMRAAFYSGDADLYKFVVEYLIKSELNCVEDVNFGQTVLLREVIQASGLQGLGRKLLDAKGTSIPHVKKCLDVAIGDHLSKTVKEWSGPKNDIFTDDFLAFVLFKDDGPLIAEYMTNLGPFSWLQSHSISKLPGISKSDSLSVTNLVEIAIDRHSCNILAYVPPDAPVLQGGALERAIYGKRAGAVELLLSRNFGHIELAESVVSDVANMTASEPWLKVLESLARHSSKVNFTRPPNWPKRLPIVTRQIVSRSKNEVDFAFRKRAIEIFRMPNSVFGEDADTDLQFSHRFLLRRITLQSLLTALPDESAARTLQIYSCVEFAAKCGDASDVIDLLTVAAANDADRLVGVEAALIAAISDRCRIDIIAAVLQYALSSNLSKDELAIIVRGAWRNLTDRKTKT
ncbi:hypothetical protein HK405_000965, partial [Cladochytrium tenue]